MVMKHIQLKMTCPGFLPAPLLGALCLWVWRSPTPWPPGWGRTRRIILPLHGLTHVSQRPGCKVIYIPMQQVMFLETRMWASSLGAILRKGQICAASEKGRSSSLGTVWVQTLLIPKCLAQWLEADLWQEWTQSGCKNHPLWLWVHCQEMIVF